MHPPAHGDNFCRLIHAAFHDSYVQKKSVILILMKKLGDYRPLVLLIGRAIPDNVKVTYGNCLAYVGNEEKAYEVVSQHLRPLV